MHIKDCIVWFVYRIGTYAGGQLKPEFFKIESIDLLGINSPLSFSTRLRKFRINEKI